MTHPSPCVGWRHASWYAHAPAYGRCVHPATVAAMSAPMVLALRHSASIQRYWGAKLHGDECRAREPITEPAPFINHVNEVMG